MFVMQVFVVCSQKIIDRNARYPLKITEVCSHNTNSHRDAKGNYDDWVEIFNYGPRKIDLEGLYITNDKNNLKKYRFEADSIHKRDLIVHKNTFRIIWCDKESFQGTRHISFRLSSKGGFIALVAPDGVTIIDSLTFPPLPADVTYGLSHLQNKYQFFDEPWPSKWNVNGKNRVCEKPKISPKSSYQNVTKLNIKVKGETSNLFYNYQGAAAPQKWKNEIALDSVSSMVFYRKDNSCARSEKVYRTFLDHSLEHQNVVALTIDTLHLWHKIYGIHEGKNYNRKMSRTSHFDFFEDNKRKVSAVVDINIHGAYSRTYPQKSLALKVSSDNDKKYLKHNFFSTVDNDSYKGLILRNAGNDWGSAKMRDVLAHSLIDNDYLSVNVQAFEPVVVYMNGEYWGAYNMREKINSDYLRYQYGANKDKVDILEKYKMVKRGKGQQFLKLQKYVSMNSLKKQDNVAGLKQWIDIDNYIDYQAIQIYIGNKDWPQNNVKCWRDIGRDGRWRWLIYDLDEGFKYPELDAINLALGLDSARLQKFDSTYTRSTIILPKMIENKLLKEQLVNRIFDLMNFTFEEKRVKHFVDSITLLMETEMEQTLKFWYPKSKMFRSSSPQSTKYLENWKKNVSRLSRFPSQRNEHLITHLKNHKWIKDVISIQVNFMPEDVFVYVNGIQLKKSEQTLIYSKDYGVNIEVISKSREQVIYPKTWKRNLNGFQVNKSGVYSIGTQNN